MNTTMRTGGFNLMPPVVKNLLIINGIFFLATVLLQAKGIDLVSVFGMHIIGTQAFRPWQIITYMFMHGSFGHIFFNMFALWMFGSAIENSLGSKKFLIYYLMTGIGAAVVHYLIIYVQLYPVLAPINHFLQNPSLDSYEYLTLHNQIPEIQGTLAHNFRLLQHDSTLLSDITLDLLAVKSKLLSPYVIIGASGSVFGLLLAFGMTFPNNYIYVYFLLPIKAKWFVIIYGAIELIYGISGTSDGIAHFAHLGGMLVGLPILLYWRKGSGNPFFRFSNPFKKRKRSRQFQKKYATSYETTYSQRPLSDEEYNARKVQEQQTLDEILDKISKNGYESLTRTEKDFLFYYGRK